MEDGEETTTTTTATNASSTELLSDLMTALAAGARAVQALPLGDEFDYQSSFPEFRHLVDESQRSLLEVLLLTLDDVAATEGGGVLMNMTSSSSSPSYDFDSLDDPLLWETCTDLCDALLEQAEASIHKVDPSSPLAATSNSERLTKELHAARNRAQKSFGRLMNGIVEMEKPQLVYKFGPQQIEDDEDDDDDEEGIDSSSLGRGSGSRSSNDRTVPFIPPFLREKYFAKGPFDLEALNEPGHGLETKYGELKVQTFVSKNVEAPTHHYAHPYLGELQSLNYPEWQLEVPSTKPPKIVKDDDLVATATWIDTSEGLDDVKAELEKVDSDGRNVVREVAVDLEAHSYRTFAGIICLIQLTFEGKDFLIDPFPLWNRIHDALAPTLANPNIVKVFHGADSDIAWLQRDFGLYVVNLFDTGRAARALRLPSYGFAHLLTRYVEDVHPDKSHQLSDWRQRPLPQSMKEYAVMDTHYLLGIYNSLKYDLDESKTTSIAEALEESRKVCTIRYTPEAFRPDGYLSLMQRRGHKTELNPRQEAILKSLWDWRDRMARLYDESHAYVLTNTQLMRLAMACPTNLSTLQGLLQPMPPLLLRNAKDVLALIHGHLQLNNNNNNKQQVSQAPSSAFFKPAISTATANAEPEDLGGEMGRQPSPRSLMSPVLGTEALYEQAGWISPTRGTRGSTNINDVDDEDGAVEDIVTTSATEDDADDEHDDEDRRRNSVHEKGMTMTRKPRRGLAVHEANQKYQSRTFTSHSLQLVEPSLDNNCEKADHDETIGYRKGEIIDGFGPARAALVEGEDMDEAVELAQNSAAQIRTSQESRGVIGFISPSTDLGADDGDNEEAGQTDGDEKEKAIEQEEFVIPRSMREIYRISNRNRSNKKASSPLPSEPNEEELQELAKAEAILIARSGEGRNYIDVIPCSPKRQRTKSSGAASLSSSDEAAGQDSGSISREDDIAVMQEVGWIESKEEIDAMLKQRAEAADADEDESSDDGGGKRETPKPFDYSTVGPIGAFAPTLSSNPFFAGAALAGGHLTQQFGKTEKKKQPSAAARGKPTRRQAERPEKRGEGRSQAYKKR